MKKIIIAIIGIIIISIPTFANKQEISVKEEVKNITDKGGEVYIDVEKECICVKYENSKKEQCAKIITYEKEGEYNEIAIRPQNIIQEANLYKLDSAIAVYSIENLKNELKLIINEM